MSRAVVAATFVLALVASACLGAARPAHARDFKDTVDTLWTDGFEGDWSSRWSDTYGTWEVGTPTSGPNVTHSGSNVACTVLAGDYVEGVNSLFFQIQPWVVPAANLHPRLRFWHWWSIGGDDAGYVQISVNGGAWQSIETFASHSIGRWTRGYVDLSAFAGQSVRIGFFFHSSTGWAGSVSVGPGWYIDDVTVETGPLTVGWPEGWENGIGSWYADRGMWEIGAPTSGPNAAHTGSNVAATILDGNYEENLDCRLISPPFVVPHADSYPRLRFWHWWNIGGDDVGYVQLRVRGGAWQSLESYNAHSSNRWTRGFVDLSTFADSSVELAFFFSSHTGWAGSYSVGPGWYIDDVVLETGQRPLGLMTTWEDGIGAWYADRGTWEVGAPTSGIGNAYAGSNVAATILDGNYDENLDCRLISPPFFVRPRVGMPIMRFHTWYNFGGDDAGYVQVRIGDGAWQTQTQVGAPSPGYSGYFGDMLWSGNRIYDLTAFIDSTIHSPIQVCFLLSSRTGWAGSYSVGPGWYIDDVQFQDTIIAFTPTLLTRFDAKATAAGIQLEWQFDQPDRYRSATLERADRTIGPWVSLALPTRRQGAVTEAVDGQVVTGATYFYRLDVEMTDGRHVTFGPISAASLLAARTSGMTALAPNPTSGSTRIDFALARDEHVKISVVDVAGREATVLADSRMTAGTYSMLWDGRAAGSRLPAGVYFVRWQGDGRTTTRRLVLVN